MMTFTVGVRRNIAVQPFKYVKETYIYVKKKKTYTYSKETKTDVKETCEQNYAIKCRISAEYRC